MPALTSPLKIPMKVSASGTEFKMAVKTTILADFTNYEGSYIVTPTVGGFSLPTKDRNMLMDLTVNPVPIRRYKNAMGGTTVEIGGDA